MKNYINISTPEGNMEFTPVPKKEWNSFYSFLRIIRYSMY